MKANKTTQITGVLFRGADGSSSIVKNSTGIHLYVENLFPKEVLEALNLEERGEALPNLYKIKVTVECEKVDRFPE